MIELRASRCAICGTEGNAVQLYPARFSPDALNPAAFSARREPDRRHFRLVKCIRCGLIRSDPVADPALLQTLYTRSQFTYAAEVVDLRHTYGRYLRQLAKLGARQGTLLEIGCGSGFFLQEALDQGFSQVWGVEPSQAAVTAAPTHLRPFIHNTVMSPGLFAPAAFDVVCLFQVLDHFPDPAGVLTECLRCIRPGGFLLAINHNATAISARLLGERSPIFDIEHTYLYTPGTMTQLVAGCGFQVLLCGSVWNRFPLGYLARLSPLPPQAKHGLLAVMEKWRLAGWRLSLPLGNLFLIARKPPAD